ncbi:hypothetical protein PtB15_12B117 [Puccinia triticina]|nr:hypothetical protein PtB15_12B117 [Puccinia triticina]
MTGFPGCCHATRLWENTELKLDESALSTPGWYLGAEPGFPAESDVAPAFTRPPQPQKRSNRHLSSACVCIKHRIGVLRGQSQSLQGLCKALSSARTMEKITHWMSACVILHNDSPEFYQADLDDSDSNKDGAPSGP